jgi:hypothetical protein
VNEAQPTSKEFMARLLHWNTVNIHRHHGLLGGPLKDGPVFTASQVKAMPQEF